jgi:hypothetical protein
MWVICVKMDKIIQAGSFQADPCLRAWASNSSRLLIRIDDFTASGGV